MSDSSARSRPPGPVLVAIVILAAQGLVLLGFSGWLLSRRTAELPSNQEVFEGSAVYLIICGLLVLLVATALRSLRGWALAAAVVVQLIAIGVAYEMASAGQWLAAVALGLSAVVVIATLMTRRSRVALGRAA